MFRSTRISARLLAILALVALAVTALLAGCGGGSSSTGGSDVAPPKADTPIAIRIGTLATEDALPLWLAQKMGYFSIEGLPKVELIEFQSAQERDAALASGTIDAMIGDIISSASLEGSGTKVTIGAVALGADTTQGRFGIAVAPNSRVTNAAQLAGVPVGTSLATIQEYVLDGLMGEVSVPDNKIKTSDVKKVMERYSRLMDGKLKAAALPEPFLTLAEQGGARIVGDDTKSATNLSQTVLVFSDTYLAKTGGASSQEAVLKAWDIAANDINKTPAAYRSLLATKARLPKPLAASYSVQVYPMAAPPKQADVDAVLVWMTSKGYLKRAVTYRDLVPK